MSWSCCYFPFLFSSSGSKIRSMRHVFSRFVHKCPDFVVSKRQYTRSIVILKQKPIYCTQVNDIDSVFERGLYGLCVKEFLPNMKTFSIPSGSVQHLTALSKNNQMECNYGCDKRHIISIGWRLLWNWQCT